MLEGTHHIRFNIHAPNPHCPTARTVGQSVLEKPSSLEPLTSRPQVECTTPTCLRIEKERSSQSVPLQGPVLKGSSPRPDLTCPPFPIGMLVIFHGQKSIVGEASRGTGETGRLPHGSIRYLNPLNPLAGDPSTHAPLRDRTHILGWMGGQDGMEG